MKSENFIQIAEHRFDEIAGCGYRETKAGAIQFANYLASLSRGNCVSVLRTENGIETRVSRGWIDVPQAEPVESEIKELIYI